MSAMLILLVVCAAAADDRAIAEPLLKVGAEVRFDSDGSATSLSVRNAGELTVDHYRALGQLRRLTILRISGASSLTDHTMPLLKDLDALEWVTLDGAKL